MASSEITPKLTPDKVFTPNNFPEKTFVDSHIEDKMNVLKEALMGGDIVSISGPSKSGKTVMVESLALQNKFMLVSPTLAGVKSSQDIWRRFLAQVNAKYETSQSVERQNGQNNEVSANIQGGIPMFASAAGTFGHSRSKTIATQTVTNIEIDYINLIINEFKNSGFILFIDDFHYLPIEVQTELAQQIKQISRDNVQIVCASIIHREQDVLRSNPDLRGRVRSIDLKYWEVDSLKEIAQKGFHVLDIDIPDEIITKFAQEAAGSPLLMQRLCLDYSTYLLSKGKTGMSVEELHILFRRNADALSMEPLVTIMKNGPKIHGVPRSTYVFKNNTSGDVYACLILALKADPPQTLFDYDNLISRVKQVCVEDKVPGSSSLTQACDKASGLVNKEAKALYMDWNAERDSLHIAEPLFIFYLRWGVV